ncbi:MAG: hypothetical protein ACI8SZ_002145 [Colwellia sp.]|jgi:hypothetical protein
MTTIEGSNIIQKGKLSKVYFNWQDRLLVDYLISTDKGSMCAITYQYCQEKLILRIYELKEGDIILNIGEMYMVPKGIEHCLKVLRIAHF